MKDADLERVKDAVSALGEHFDTVQIFTTRHESGEKDGTTNVSWGAGNWFARYGQVRTWMVRSEEEERENIRSESE